MDDDLLSRALEGFIAFDGAEWMGEITYAFSGSDCEIVSIDSVREGHGIGTKLIQAVVAEARQQNCKRLFRDYNQ